MDKGEKGYKELEPEKNAGMGGAGAENVDYMINWPVLVLLLG